MALNAIGCKFVPLPVINPDFPHVKGKPTGCNLCPYRKIGAGFVPDYYGKSAKIALVLEAPGQTEYLQGTPLVGKAGRYWLRKLIEPNGYTREDCVICNTIRCRPPDNKYPTGKMRVHAETFCRRYDTELKRFNPNFYVCSLHPSALLRSPAALRLVQADVQKAFKFAEKGYRPVVLFGEKAAKKFLGVDVGIKKLRGDYGRWEYPDS